MKKQSSLKRSNQLLEMLRYRRPAGSATEREFISKYLDSIPGMFADGFGNRLLVCADSKVMISTHTDTVHQMGGMQRVSQSRAGVVSLALSEQSNCLGADDTAGIYAALRMIEAGVKATFIFHREEEIGGNGSKWLAENYPEWLAQFDICLALDRRGTRDIITYQGWAGECASEEFAESLGAALGMEHRSADGIFTDSANYVDLIPECSNLSIGYQNEHSREETLDTWYLEALIERLIGVNWKALAVCREPMGDYGGMGHGI